MCGYIWYNIDNSYQKSAAHIIMWGGLVLKDARRRGLIRYLPVLILFLCYLAVCLGLFFWQVGNAIEKNTLQSLRSNVQRQCYHFRSMLDIQFSTLESLADHMGRPGVAARLGQSRPAPIRHTGRRILPYDADHAGWHRLFQR